MFSNRVNGINPVKMGLDPIPVVKEALTETRLSVSGIDLFEVNEAFALQAIVVQQKPGTSSWQV